MQGVAWDPLNEYVATQSSDRSVHIYTLKTKDGQFTLAQHNKVTKMDLPGRRISSNSPAPPDLGPTSNRASFVQDATSAAVGSPVPSAPGTPQSLAIPMNPPPTSHSRRSSFGSQVTASLRRSVSPSPSTMPLPAVMPSASPSMSGALGLGVRNTNIYANETFTSFFRRLTFSPDGSLLFTPAGQYKTANTSGPDSKKDDDILNTVYIYTRAGLNKPPVAHLPGHKKASIAVKCSPVQYTLRTQQPETKEITIDTKGEEDIPALPEPVMPTKPRTSHAAMDPPPLTSAPSPSPSVATMASPRNPDVEPSPTATAPPTGPLPAFALPYRIVYAVATQDAVHVYDTQQQKPLCVVSNLHYATFTDLSWSSDGQTLLMTSSDGFCSALTFSSGELGSIYYPPAGASRQTPTPISVAKANSTASTPQATPTTATAPTVPTTMSRQSSSQPSGNGTIAPPPAPSPSPFTAAARPASPARSMSTSSVGTQSGFVPDQNAPPAMNNPTPSMGSVPSMTAAGSSQVPLFTPPQTPSQGLSGSTAGYVPVASGVKRESGASDAEDAGREKRRRIAPTPVGAEGDAQAAPPTAPPSTHEGAQ